MHDELLNPATFDGVVRLFPLPGLVFYPHTVQALHIFEPRYRQMTADAIATDQLISIVMLGDDWDKNYDTKPSIQEFACVGKIIAQEQLHDGRYNLLLQGIARIQILEELPTEKLYRVARVKILTDFIPEDLSEIMRLRTLLADTMIPKFHDEAIRKHVTGMFQGETPLGQLCDVLSYALPMPPIHKQQLLETTNVLDRARLLLAGFQALIAERDSTTGAVNQRKFPPDFSEN